MGGRGGGGVLLSCIDHCFYHNSFECLHTSRMLIHTYIISCAAEMAGLRSQALSSCIDHCSHLSEYFSLSFYACFILCACFMSYTLTSSQGRRRWQICVARRCSFSWRMRGSSGSGR